MGTLPHLEKKSNCPRTSYFRSWRNVRNEIIDQCKNIACMDCGVRYDPWVMQFDHRDPSKKEMTIGSSRMRALPKVLKEIQKCDVVCANCHSQRTHRQQIAHLTREI